MSKWEMVRLSDIIDEAITGEWGTECADDEVGTKILRTTNFTNLGVINFDNVVVRSIPASKVKKKRLKRNDIILEKSGGSDNQPVGRVVFFEHGPDKVFLCNNFTQALRIKSRVAFPRYVFLYLLRLHQNGTTELLQNKTTGIRNLQVKQYMALEIPLPPPDIQRQIAGLLDRASVLIEKRKAQIDKLDLLVKSQFIGMFGDPVTNPKGWQTKLLGELATLKSGKNVVAKNIHDLSARYQYPCYGGNGIRGYVDMYSHEGTYPLIGRQGALCGNVQLAVGCFYPTEHAVVVAPAKDYSIIWMFYCLVYLNLNRLQTGAAQPGLNIDILNKVEIPFPPGSLQIRFADFIHQVEAQKSLFKQSLAKLELNYKSLMQKCFAGEVF